MVIIVLMQQQENEAIVTHIIFIINERIELVCI